MDLISIEAPAARVAAAGEALEFLDASLGIVASSKGLEVVADQLVEALSQRTGRPPGSSNCLFVDRKGDIHGHSICAQGCCAKPGSASAPPETRVHCRSRSDALTVRRTAGGPGPPQGTRISDKLDSRTFAFSSRCITSAGGGSPAMTQIAIPGIARPRNR
jgi:hypothetical protein